MLAVCLLCTQEVSNLPKVQTLCTALWNSLVSFRLVLQHWDRLPTSQIILQLGTCFSIGVHATVHTPCDFVNFCHMYYSTFDLAAEVAKMRAGWGDMRQSHVCPWELVFSLAGLRSTAFGLHTHVSYREFIRIPDDLWIYTVIQHPSNYANDVGEMLERKGALDTV